MSSFRIVLIFSALALLGVLLATRLSLHFTPAPLTSSFTISYQWPGKSPLLVEQQVTAILENELSQIDGLLRIYSRSGTASGSITLDFDADEDLAFKKIEVLTILRKLKDQLPSAVGFPVVSESNGKTENEEPLLIYALVADNKLTTIQEVVDRSVLPKIGSISGIREVQLSGTATEALHLEYDPDKLKSSRLDPRELIKKLNMEASVTFESTLKDKDQELPVVFGKNLPFAELSRITLNSDLHLGQVAKLSLVEQKQQYIHRINGKRAVLLSLFAHERTNRIQVANEAEVTINMLQDNLPPGFSLFKRYDDTTFLREELSKASYRSVFSVAILCLFILLFTRRWKQLVVLFGSIIINIGLVLLLAYMLHLEIHLYTIAGLTVSFGLLVDNAIVMLDHFSRYRNRRIISGLLAASLTTIAALGVIFLLPQEDRQNLTDFSLIIILSLACSLVVAWWYTPALAQLLGIEKRLKKRSYRRRYTFYKLYHKQILWLSKKRKLVIALLILGFGLPVYLLPSKVENNEWYNSTIGSDHYQDNIRPHVDRYLGGASRLFYRNVFERSGFRDPDKTRLYMQAQLPFGHTMEQMNITLQRVEDYLQQVEGLTVFLTYIYSGQQGRIIIEFDEDKATGSLPYVLKNRLTAKALDWGGVDWDIYGVGRGFSNKSGDPLPGFRVQMKGYQFDKLKELSEIFAKKLLAHKRVQEVNTNDHMDWGGKDLEELTLIFDQRYFQSPPSKTTSTLTLLKQAAYQENPQTFISVEGKRVPVYMEPKRSATFSPYYLMNHSFSGNDPLKTVAEIQHTVGTPEVHKEDRQYLRMVSFEYFGSHRFGDKYLNEVIADMQPLLPAGFNIEKKSRIWFGEKEKRQYSLLLLLMIVIYVICVVFFENFIHPFLIIFIIPLSFIGLFLIFAWGDFYFDQGGYAAFLMLGGLVVNAAIFIFSDYKHQRSRIQSKRVTKAVWGKAWPITLTVVSTCVGLVPFLINGDSEVFWFSLAIGMIGGLIFSTLLVLVILPSLMISNNATPRV